MPNWVSNRITIVAEGTTELDTFLEKAKGEQSQIRSEGNEKFHFGAFVHPPEEGLPYYRGEIEEEKPEGWAEMSSAEQMAHTLKFSGRGWYDWNVTNWGTKWDACDTYIERVDELTASIDFSTAWSPPEPIFRAMVEQSPELSFEIYYEEEQGWGGELVGSNGELSLIREWDIPSSHADYVERDNVDGCNCSWSDDKEDWYDDCPGKREIFVRVTQVYKLTAQTLEEARTEVFELETGERSYPEPESDYGVTELIDEDGTAWVDTLSESNG
jgi:hypothetical protein